MKRLAVALVWVGLVGQQSVLAEEALVEPTSVEKLVADGKHNAFTALCRWKDAYWLAFRKGPSHAYGEADIHVWRSPDAKKWTEVLVVNALPDDRDPQFLVTPQRLFLYDPALRGSELTSFVVYTDDGEKWADPQPVYEPRFIMWKPIAHKGRFYAAAHKKVEGSEGGKAREVHLITSTDGLKWEKISTIRAGNWESETTLYFAPDETLVAFLRQKYGGGGSILKSAPPYTQWTQRPAPVHLSGHCVHTFEGVTYLISRTIAGKQTGTMIYLFEDDMLRPYCKLPSGGDCSYAEAVQVGGEMLISYYSSHEGTTNVYLARVPLKR